MNWWKLAPPEGRRFGLLAAGGLVYVLPILLADRYYQEDLARSLYGATGWAGDGRPLTEWLMELLAGGGTTVVDLSPLPMLLGLAALAYALTLYARQAFPALRESKLATLALGFVLGPTIEDNLQRALIAGNGSPLALFSSPLSIGLWVVAIVLTSWMFIRNRKSGG